MRSRYGAWIFALGVGIWLAPALDSVGPVIAAAQQQQQQDNTSLALCEAVKDSLYKTELERTQDPCRDQCTYDLETQQLSIVCRYEYCRECDPELGFCGYRYIQIDTTLSNETIADLMVSPQNTTVSQTKMWCILYDEGALGGRKICAAVDESFNSNCESQWQDLPYGLPLLSCDTTLGCLCKVEDSGIAKTDPFIGLERLEFETCYDPDAKAPTELSSETQQRHWMSAQAFAFMVTAALWLQ